MSDFPNSPNAGNEPRNSYYVPIVIEHPKGKPAEAFVELAGAVEKRVAELSAEGAPQVDLNWS